MNMKIKVEFRPVDILELITLCEHELESRKMTRKRAGGFCGDPLVLMGALKALRKADADNMLKELVKKENHICSLNATLYEIKLSLIHI